MSKLQRLTPKRTEQLKGAVIKDVITEEIPKDMDILGEGFLSVVSIDLEDGRTLFVCSRGTEDLPVTELSIQPKKRGGGR